MSLQNRLGDGLPGDDDVVSSPATKDKQGTKKKKGRTMDHLLEQREDADSAILCCTLRKEQQDKDESAADTPTTSVALSIAKEEYIREKKIGGRSFRCSNDKGNLGCHRHKLKNG